MSFASVESIDSDDQDKSMVQHLEKANKQYTLPIISAVASACVLEEAADQLAILGTIGNLPKVEADLTYKPFEERFDSYLAEIQIFDPDTIEPYEVALSKAKFYKFQSDRSFCEKILRETVTSLKFYKNFNCIQTHIDNYHQNVSAENEVLKKEEDNAKLLEEQRNLIEKEKKEAVVQHQALSEHIGNLKDTLEDLRIENKIKSSYVDNWENSRIEQNNTFLDKQEEYYLNIINETKGDIEKEMRINAEIEAFITESQQDYLDQIESWMDRYDADIEQRDTDLQILKEKREEQFLQLQQLSLTYHLHKQEMEEYLAYKEKCRLEAELIAFRIRMVTIIQAWWRGTMVRKGFGPFKRKKEKKKGKK